MMFYNTPANTFSGMRNRMSLCFVVPVSAALLPYVCICLYTYDKTTWRT
jgi:hypothetical protein